MFSLPVSCSTHIPELILVRSTERESENNFINDKQPSMSDEALNPLQVYFIRLNSARTEAICHTGIQISEKDAINTVLYVDHHICDVVIHI